MKIEISVVTAGNCRGTVLLPYLHQAGEKETSWIHSFISTQEETV